MIGQGWSSIAGGRCDERAPYCCGCSTDATRRGGVQLFILQLSSTFVEQGNMTYRALTDAELYIHDGFIHMKQDSCDER